MLDLIHFALEKKIRDEGPLAQRMRPTSLEQFTGQKQIIGVGKPLYRMIESDRLVSMIFYGPPGTGKTSLAKIIAAVSKASFTQLNAVAAGVKDVRQVIEKAGEDWSMHNRRTILFIDEIHRFSKSQQDVLLAAVEDGTIIFIGATTENPFFYLSGPLLSRTRLIRFEALNADEIVLLLKAALKAERSGLANIQIDIEDGSLELLAKKADGDARAALNTLETALLIGNEHDNQIRITLETIMHAFEERLYSYDRSGDSHYDCASALIKSIRGSDPDAAIYWMARMLHGGEDPLFIARRLLISAAEDIGNADPFALTLALSAAQAVQIIGMPEGRIPLAQAVTYLAGSPKSNASYLAIDRALKYVSEEESFSVPIHLKGTGYRGSSRLGHGEGYRYPHDYPGHYIEQDYMPLPLKGKKFYCPTEMGRERKIKDYLTQLKKDRRK